MNKFGGVKFKILGAKHIQAPLKLVAYYTSITNNETSQNIKPYILILNIN